MKTVTNSLQEMADELKINLQTLLLDHSTLHYWNSPNEYVVFISTDGDYAYQELSETGRQIQAKLLEDYRRFNSLVKTLLREQPTSALAKYSEAEMIVLRTIEQKFTWCKTTQEAFNKAAEGLQDHLILLKNLYDPSDGNIVYVPDTNALLYNPTLTKWEFKGVSSFTLVFTPTILSELDHLKINHRNEDVRKKAETLINQLKEFRRRGRLSDGITLVKDKSTILSIAVEPNMNHSLPWLDSNNNDDRFLATVIEIMRLRPRSAVFAVSRDINFQNKAEFAHVQFVEPPELIPVP